MKEKLYQLMNWAEIEGIVYSDEDRPGTILGPHPAGNSILYQAFFPNAKKVTLVLEDKEKRVVMDLADEEGFYAATATGKKAGPYHYEIEDQEGNVVSRKDPYAFKCDLDQEDVTRYRGGIHYELYKVMGSHEKTIDGVKGIHFTAWVPGAVRISVVGQFNQWDGRVYPMNRVDDTDIFTLFIPGLDADTIYQYEVKEKNETIFLMNDPYADWIYTEEKQVSRVHTESTFKWEDETWIAKRNAADPICAVYEWDGQDVTEAKTLADCIKKQGFSHIALPAMRLEDNFYDRPEYFANLNDAKEFVNTMHKAGVGVLFNWQANVCHELGWSEVSNYFIANVLYWMEEYHMDGLILSELESLLYLDYGKEPGQWSPNIFGGNENLEGIEFVKHTNSILTKRNEGVLLFADLDAIWPKVTKPMDEDGLGFHYRYDTDFTKDYLWYLVTDPYFRSNIHGKIVERMVYAYSERFVMVLPKKSVANLWDQIPGEEKDKFSTMKAAFAYISLLPGKTLSALQVPESFEKDFQAVVAKCNELNEKQAVLAREDDNWENFQWINCFQNNECTVSFMRKGENGRDSLLVTANFANDEKEEFIIGIPYEGKYELIFSTEETAFGGKEEKTSLIYTDEREWDGFGQSITVPMKPLSVSVYRYVPFTEKEIFEFAERKAEAIRLQLEEEARQKAALLKKAMEKSEVKEEVEETAQEEVKESVELKEKTAEEKLAAKKTTTRKTTAAKTTAAKTTAKKTTAKTTAKGKGKTK